MMSNGKVDHPLVEELRVGGPRKSETIPQPRPYAICDSGCFYFDAFGLSGLRQLDRENTVR